jgi:transposase
MGEVIVGIDLGIRAKHVAAIRSGNGSRSPERRRFAHTSTDLDGLWDAIRKERRSSRDRVRVLLEPTGMSWFPVSQYLQRRGCEVVRVTGRQVQALRSYLSRHTKTDLVDAGVLAQIPSFGESHTQPLRLPTARELALKRCVKQRGRFVQQKCDTMRRLKDLVRWAHPALEAALRGELTSATARAVLRAYFNPFAMRRLGKARLQAFLETHGATTYPGIRGSKPSLAATLMEAACETIALYETSEVVDFQALQREVTRELDLFEAHRAAVRELDAEIQTLAQQTGMNHLVESLPGVATVLGGVLLAYAGDSKRFRNVGAFKAYCGMIPRVEQSATTRSTNSTLTKTGPNQLKRALYLAADIARQTDPQLARIYHTQMAVKRHHHRQAVCAVATHLATRLYTVLREHRPYQLRDPEGRAISVEEGRELVRERFQVPDEIRSARRRAVDEPRVEEATAQQEQGDPSSAPSPPGTSMPRPRRSGQAA